MADEKYDPSWDYDYGEEGYDESALDHKYAEWDKRDWMEWLRENLTFPFRAERMEDSYLDMFAPEELHAKNPYPVGCQVTVSGIADLRYNRKLWMAWMKRAAYPLSWKIIERLK